MIDAIQEIRWQENKITDIGGYTMCYGSDDEKKIILVLASCHVKV